MNPEAFDDRGNPSMTQADPGSDPSPRRRRTGGLWRLLPFATIGLVILGNYKHASEGRMPGLDGQDYVVLGLLIAAFIAAYGRPAAPDAVAAPRRAALGPIAATILAVAVALLFSLPAFARFAPHSAADWRVAGMDLVIAWLLVDFFQAWLRPATTPSPTETLP
jgi:hypothetical protein